MTLNDSMLVAIDGPAGSGKSSVSKQVAVELGFGMLDTGAAYRALAATAIARGIDLDDEDAIADVLNDWQLSIALDPEHRQVSADGVDVTETIREPRISAAVSQVARVAAVRMVLNESFRDMVAHSGLPGVVVEGRDITTVVAPDAPVRILLTASEEVRAARRARELGDADTANVADDMTKRDAADSRVVEFMTAAEGVITIDSSNLTFQQTVDAVIAVIRDAEAAAR
jgi:cytidylate kinase